MSQATLKRSDPDDRRSLRLMATPWKCPLCDEPQTPLVTAPEDDVPMVVCPEHGEQVARPRP